MNTLARPAGSTAQSRRDNQSVRERWWLRQRGQFFFSYKRWLNLTRLGGWLSFQDNLSSFKRCLSSSHFFLLKSLQRFSEVVFFTNYITKLLRLLLKREPEYFGKNTIHPLESSYKGTLTPCPRVVNSFGWRKQMQKATLKLSRRPKFPYGIPTDKNALEKLQINQTGF